MLRHRRCFLRVTCAWREKREACLSVMLQDGFEFVEELIAQPMEPGEAFEGPMLPTAGFETENLSAAVVERLVSLDCLPEKREPFASGEAFNRHPGTETTLSRIKGW